MLQKDHCFYKKKETYIKSHIYQTLNTVLCYSNKETFKESTRKNNIQSILNFKQVKLQIGIEKKGIISRIML
jgi:hypothetical protein